MALCKSCENEVDELFAVKVAGKTKKLCEDCKDRLQEEGEVREESARVVRGMMGYKGER